MEREDSCSSGTQQGVAKAVSKCIRSGSHSIDDIIFLFPDSVGMHGLREFNCSACAYNSYGPVPKHILIRRQPLHQQPTTKFKKHFLEK